MIYIYIYIFIWISVMQTVKNTFYEYSKLIQLHEQLRTRKLGRLT